MGAVALEIKNATGPTDALCVDIRKRFSGDGNFELHAEFSVSIGVSILFGPSGAGKTTMLDCIAGLTVPDSGQITVAGREFFNRQNGVNLSSQKRAI